MSILSMKKKFYGVYFSRTNQTAVVPLSWIQETKKGAKCRWPTEGDPEQLSRAQAEADDGWPYFICTLFTMEVSAKYMKMHSRAQP